MSDPFNMENVAAMAGLPHTRREMTDTVQIMPRQPMEAKRDEFGEGYYVERGTSIIQRDYLNSGGVGWVEVPEPIVWDRTDGAFDAIRAAFEGTANYASRDDNPSSGWGHSGCLWVGVGQESSLVPPGWRIQIVDDSFVILPPRGDLTSGETVRVTRFVSSEESR